jgi:tetratricopeptide (TPR) repeat protein
MPLESGTRLGPYEVISRLGVGGMGEVYTARDTRLDRRVAIKVLPGDAVTDPKRLQRFLAEAKAVSALNHPNILTLHEIGESESGPFLVTELVQGHTIREILAQRQISIQEAIDYAVQAAEGLAKAHGSGIVHRDLKPENLMVTDDGFVKVLDFGLAKLLESDLSGGQAVPTLTKSGTIVGTVGYVSPEQLHGAEADYKSDLFALGVVLFEMLTRRHPFVRETTAETLNAILHRSPPNASKLRSEVPDELSSIVERALEKDPERRYADVQEFASELRTLREGQTTPSQGIQARTPRWTRGRLIAMAGTGILGAVIAVGLLTRARDSAVAVALPEGQTAVAVLPIDDESGEPELTQAGIGGVLADAFVQILVDVPGVYVVSPFRLNEVAATLGRPIEDANQDQKFAREVCRLAQAEAVLAGKLSKVGDVYVLNADLTELSSERLLGTFRAESRSKSRFLAELTESVTAEIQGKLNPGATDGQAIDGVATSFLEAYTNFIRGRDLMEEGRWQEAVPELTKAINRDADMGLAWSALACAYSFAGDDASSRAAQKRAEELLDRVNQKERRWIQLNGTWVNTGNGPQYRKEAEQFIRDFPDDREGYYYAGLGAQYLEKNCEEALGFYEMAYQLTPSFYAITKGLVECNLELGRRDEALKALKRFLSLPMIGRHGRGKAEWQLNQLEGTPGGQAGR